MSVTEWIMTNWELLSLLVNGVFALLFLMGRSRLKDAETKATRASSEATKAQSDLEETRNQGAQTMAILKLLEGQLVQQARLAAAIEQNNAIRQQENEQYEKERTQHAEVVAGVLKSNDRVIELITGFQEFSKEQHNQTRQTVGEVGGKVDTVAENVQAGREDFAAFKRDMNGYFRRLPPSLQNRFASGEENLDKAIKQLPDTDKLNPADVPDSDPANKPTPPTEPPSADAVA